MGEEEKKKKSSQKKNEIYLQFLKTCLSKWQCVKTQLRSEMTTNLYDDQFKDLSRYPLPQSSCRYPSVFPWGAGWSVRQYICFVRCHHVASRPLNCTAQARKWKPVNVRTISLLPHAFLVIWIFNTFLPGFVNLSHDLAFSCRPSLIITINCSQLESVRV